MPATPSSRLFLGLLPWYSVLIVTGILAALFLAIRQEKRAGLPRDTMVDLALWVVPCGIIGGRLYYVAFAWDTFAAHPISILYIWRGGMAIYGAIIGGALAVAAFARKRKLPLGSLTDVIVPGLALAQAIGRWGNYFNMEAYGAEVTSTALQFFPFAVLIPGTGGGTWHMATFFYESVWDFGVFVTLMLLRPHRRKCGDTTLWYFLLYGAGRLIIEGLRTDSLMSSSGAVRVSQLLSTLLCLAVELVFLLRHLPKGRKSRCLPGCASGVLLSLLLPFPHEAFPLYRLCWSLQLTLSCTAATLLLTWKVLPVLLFAAGSCLLHLHFTALGAAGLEASTALCMAFSAMVISSAATLYADHS